jgi:hypothetical protein
MITVSFPPAQVKTCRQASTSFMRMRHQPPLQNRRSVLHMENFISKKLRKQTALSQVSSALSCLKAQYRRRHLSSPHQTMLCLVLPRAVLIVEPDLTPLQTLLPSPYHLPLPRRHLTRTCSNICPHAITAKLLATLPLPRHPKVATGLIWIQGQRYTVFRPSVSVASRCS